MRHVYIVQTMLARHDVENLLKAKDADSHADYSNDVLYVNLSDSNVLIQVKGGVEDGDIVPISHQQLDFSMLRNRQCPRCERTINLRTHPQSCCCGFNWGKETMWMESEIEEK